MAEEKKAMKTEKATKAQGVSQDEKTMAIVAWFIFFVPLLTDQKDSEFVKFHVNQSLVLTLVSFAGYIISSILVVVLIGLLLLPVVGIGVFVLWVIGLMSAINGERKPLPIIGNIQLIK